MTDRYKTDVKSKNFKRINGIISCPGEHCNKTFKSLEGAYAHYEGVHIGQLVYPCNFCEKVYKSHHVLRCHISNQHDAQQMGKVTCELCGGSYVSAKAMRHHKRTLHLESPQPLLCSFCPKTFSTIYCHMIH